MLKTKRLTIVLVSVIIFSMVAIYGFGPAAYAVTSLESASVLLGDSNLEATATSTVSVNFGDTHPLTEGQIIRVSYEDALWLNFANVYADCGDDMTASTTNTAETYQVVECVVDPGKYLAATGTTLHTFDIGQITNPNAESATGYNITISTHDTNGSEIESSQVKVYILNDVEVSAHVNASLTFSVSELGPHSVRNTINGVPLTGTSTDQSLGFGTIDSTGSTTLGHELAVSTNASNGYVVTVQQDHEMRTAAGDTINSFDNAPDGQATTTADTWKGPSTVLGNDATYGHMGLTTEDDIAAFSGSKYVGLNGANPVTIMSHDGPAIETAEDVGLSAVAYTVEISALQEAGDYTSNITYVCTPTY